MHWYDPKTNQASHTVEKAKGGGDRPTTLRDARKLGLVPSVTNIIGLLDKPFLLIWKEQQLLTACSDWPYVNGDDIDEWKKQCTIMANRITFTATENGRKIHNMLEDYFKQGTITIESSAYIAPVTQLLRDRFGDVEWVAEEVFTHDGYGGTCDLYSREANVVLDFKTKNKDDLQKLKPYKEHSMQLAAYREGLDLPTAKCYNLFISTSNMGEMLLHEWGEEEIQRSKKMFNLLRDFWYLSNNITRSEVGDE